MHFTSEGSVIKIWSTARKRTSPFLIALSISVVHHLLLFACPPSLLHFWPHEPSVLFFTVPPGSSKRDSKCITPVSALVHSDKHKLVWGHLQSWMFSGVSWLLVCHMLWHVFVLWNYPFAKPPQICHWFLLKFLLRRNLWVTHCRWFKMRCFTATLLPGLKY